LTSRLKVENPHSSSTSTKLYQKFPHKSEYREASARLKANSTPTKMAKTPTFDHVVRAMPAPGLMSVERHWLTKNDLLRIKEDNRRTAQHQGGTEEGCCRRGLLTCFESYKQRYIRKAAINVVLLEQERQRDFNRKQENEAAIAVAYRNISNRSCIEAVQRGRMDAYEAKYFTPAQLHRLGSSALEKAPRPSKVPRRSEYFPRRSHFTSGGMAA
jgi:hypothetical protein